VTSVTGNFSHSQAQAQAASEQHGGGVFRRIERAADLLQEVQVQVPFVLG
jgi:ABC-type taurine transport system substrate-binding protein